MRAILPSAPRAVFCVPIGSNTPSVSYMALTCMPQSHCHEMTANIKRPLFWGSAYSAIEGI